MAHTPHDDAHHFPPTEVGDDIPAHGPVAEEPRSPVWLPYLGAALLGLILVWWLSTPSDAEEAKAAAAASASASAAAVAEPAPAPQPANAPAGAPTVVLPRPPPLD